MTIRSRVTPSDEEFGKREDDERTKLHPNGWLPKSSRTPLFRRRRVLALVVGCLLLWFLVRSIPRSTFGDRRNLQRHSSGRARPEQREPIDNGEDLWRQAQQAQDDEVPESSTKSQERETKSDAQDFDGPIRFYYLASSLHAAAKFSGQRASNKNILFAAADLKSAADLIPLACEMARWKRNNVHVAVAGRDAVPLDEVKKINSVENEALCPVFWHDARPDFAKKSSNHRMEVSVAGALGHIESFMHPQAIITNYPYHEDEFFVRAVSRKTKELDQTHIELPKGAAESMSWVARLSAGALHSWHAATIDIVVQAPQDTSSNMVRLLKSLERADYGGFLPPRLTVELPHKLHYDTMVFLDKFEWPPSQYQSHLPYHELVLHRRIPEKRLTDYEASTRFMESFYPYDTMDSHLLVLSPQAQLSPTFFHYLKYHMLEYRYADDADNLFGISLETPSSYLNGTEDFLPPAADPDATQNSLSPFLWQAPNTGAALIFADKWIELHSFLTQFMSASSHPKTRSYYEKRQKQVSEHFPSWAEYLLDLMKARGYYFMYPGIISGTTTGSSLAVMHDDMFQIPEEFLKSNQKQDVNPNDLPSGDVLEGSDTAYLSSHHTDSDREVPPKERPLLRSLLSALPTVPVSISKPARSDGGVPEPVPALQSLPLLDHQGLDVSHHDLVERTLEAAITFRHSAGGCTETESRNVAVIHGNAEDLFCVDEEPENESQVHIEESLLKNDVEDSPPKQKSKADDDDRIERTDDPTPTKQQFKATGAAASVHAAVNPESYAATAAAGFQEKLKSQKKYADDIATLDIDEHALTNEERRELNSLKARMKNLREADAGEKTESQPKSQSKKTQKGPLDIDTNTENAETAQKPTRSRADDEKDAKKAEILEPVLDEREYERTDEYAPELPAPKGTVVERPTEVGTRPDHTDEALNRGSAGEDSKTGNGNADRSRKKNTNLPEEAQDSAIGGKGGKVAKKGRIGGWDVGGYDEGILDEKAAAAGRLDFARTRDRKLNDPGKQAADDARSELSIKQAKVQKDIGPDEPDNAAHQRQPG